MIVMCSNCGHVFRRHDLRPGDLVRCSAKAPLVPVVDAMAGFQREGSDA